MSVQTSKQAYGKTVLIAAYGKTVLIAVLVVVHCSSIIKVN